jgi:hypothetical protein
MIQIPRTSNFSIYYQIKTTPIHETKQAIKIFSKAQLSFGIIISKLQFTPKIFTTTKKNRTHKQACFIVGLFGLVFRLLLWLCCSYGGSYSFCGYGCNDFEK